MKEAAEAIVKQFAGKKMVKMVLCTFVLFGEQSLCCFTFLKTISNVHECFTPQLVISFIDLSPETVALEIPIWKLCFHTLNTEAYAFFICCKKTH